FNTIRSLVLSASVMKMFSSLHRPVIDNDRFWKHSIACAMAAKAIARKSITIRMMDPESAFCAGILHDIGKLIFSEFAQEDYSAVGAFARKNNVPLIEAEKTMLGISHADIGRILADKWALPLDLEYALVFHHEPMKADSLIDLVTTVHMANVFSHRIGAGLWEDEPIPSEWDQARSILRMGEADIEGLLLTLKESIDKSKEYIDIIK
ncbi:MAG: HDOD domain-containing protein, partial [Chitinispirillaceae bacterium]|nr:HDOD domain-containing protein [Chitinispirillaceae bacterium]